MVSHYTAIVIITAISMMGFIICIRGNTFMGLERRRWFQAQFFALILACLGEWLAAVLDGNAAWIPIRTAAKFVELSLTPTVVLLTMLAVGNRKFLKLTIGLTAGNVLLQVVSLFTGVVFTIDAGGIYHRHGLYPLYVALFLLASVLLLVDTLDYVKRYQVGNRLLLATVFLMEAMSVAEQFAFPYLRLDWTMMAFTAVLFCLYIDQLLQQVDPLTELLNRRTYEVHIQRLRRNTVVIFFDVDRFKEVNDTYGHAVGDECLCQVAAQIKQVFGKSGYCYRYGGDEFCVLLRRNQEQLEQLLARLNRQLRAATYGGDHLLPRVSYGYAAVTENRSFCEAVREADEQMYRNKNSHRS